MVSVTMNNETPWTLEPYHIKTAFRKAGVQVPAEAITLPDRPISGPDMNLEGKEFFVHIQVK